MNGCRTVARSGRDTLIPRSRRTNSTSSTAPRVQGSSGLQWTRVLFRRRASADPNRSTRQSGLRQGGRAPHLVARRESTQCRPTAASKLQNTNITVGIRASHKTIPEENGVINAQIATLTSRIRYHLPGIVVCNEWMPRRIALDDWSQSVNKPIHALPTLGNRGPVKPPGYQIPMRRIATASGLFICSESHTAV